MTVIATVQIFHAYFLTTLVNNDSSSGVSVSSINTLSFFNEECMSINFSSWSLMDDRLSAYDAVKNEGGPLTVGFIIAFSFDGQSNVVDFLSSKSKITVSCKLKVIACWNDFSPLNKNCSGSSPSETTYQISIVSNGFPKAAVSSSLNYFSFSMSVKVVPTPL